MTELHNVPQCACGDLPVPLEEANWVIDGRPYCQRSCYDSAIHALSEIALSNATQKEKEMAVEKLKKHRE